MTDAKVNGLFLFFFHFKNCKAFPRQKITAPNLNGPHQCDREKIHPVKMLVFLGLCYSWDARLSGCPTKNHLLSCSSFWAFLASLVVSWL